jgi:periplasmic divalent cation tolerance protein
VTASCAVLITAPSAKEAAKVSDVLLKEKLAACVNVVPGVSSRYWWKGRIESAREHLLIAKTLRRKLPALVRRVKAVHPYSVPEVVSLSVGAGNPDYLRWIADSLR